MQRPLAIACFAAASLAYEVLLVRAFAIEHFHHFAYMAIGIAMLGFGASGTLLAVAGRMRPETVAHLFTWSGAAAPFALVLSPALVDLIPLDATQLAWNAGQWPRLALTYLLLAVPFGVTALPVLSGLIVERTRAGVMYGASFLGSGMGGLLAVGVLWVAVPDRALAMPALIAAVGALVSTYRASPPRGPATVTAWVGAALTLVTFVRPLWTLDVSPYKGLPQVEAFPNAQRVAEATSPLGWVVAVDAPAQRYAPGLSLSFTGDFPPQTGLFVDGELASAVPHLGSVTDTAFMDWLPTALPYASGRRRRVLVLGAGGGTEVLNAVMHGADSVVAVELNPDLARFGRQRIAIQRGENGNQSDHRVTWVVGDARSYVTRTRRRFDLITLGATGGPGTAAAGVHALGEDFLNTVDAYVEYLEHLTPDGVLAVTRWLTVPPRENVRAILTAGEALRRVSPDNARDGLFVMRSWATATVMVKPSGFGPVAIEALSSWTRRRGFDIDWHGGLDEPTDEFHLTDEPVLFDAAAAGTAGRQSAAAFASAYPFDVRPVTDARPYPHHFIRPGSVGAFLQSSRGTWLPFAEWGFVALIATLVQSIVLAGLLTLLPAALGTRGTRRAFSLPLVGYFTAIGLAYLAAEIAAIQQLGLLLGHPVYAVAVGLALFLISSGVGSALSDRVAARRGWVALGVVALLLLLHAAVLLQVVRFLQPFPGPVRAVVGAVEIIPVAFLMGLPFPLGLRLLAGADRTRIAWAWATNGFASVVAAPLAALIALELGSPTVFLFAAASYAAAAWIHQRAGRASAA